MDIKHLASEQSLTINGQTLNTDAQMDVINPATGRVFAKAPVAGMSELNAAVDAASAAFTQWQSTDIKQRRQFIHQSAKALLDNTQSLANLLTLEQGRPLAQAKAEVAQAADWISALAEIDLPNEKKIQTPDCDILVSHQALGVVCALVPWNYPLLTMAWKMAHAVLTGNTVVIKPSPTTPLASLQLGKLLGDIFPAGVVNTLSGGDDLGPMMTAHAGFAKVSFTGSTATGKRIMRSAADDLKRLTLELGGNDAAIVLADFDMDKHLEALFMSAFFNVGQICVATKRLYVHDSIYDEVKNRLHAMAQQLKVGDGMEPDSVFGPIQNKPQYQRVKHLIANAKAQGLTLLEGAAVPRNDGYFVPLTIVDNPPEDSQVVVEEAFGPVLPMMRFTDVEQVIRKANQSEYGLGGSVWTSNIQQAIAIAKQINTGTVRINQNALGGPLMAFGGARQSGLGLENGVEGLLEFTQRKNIVIPK